jgi:hypothetical protein
LELTHRISGRQLGHRPDLVGLLDDGRIAVEVELAAKSKRRLTRFFGSTARGSGTGRPPASCTSAAAKKADAGSIAPTSAST